MAARPTAPNQNHHRLSNDRIPSAGFGSVLMVPSPVSFERELERLRKLPSVRRIVSNSCQSLFNFSDMQGVGLAKLHQAGVRFVLVPKENSLSV
jgi:hypothetical protein